MNDQVLLKELERLPMERIKTEFPFLFDAFEILRKKQTKVGVK